MYLFVHFAGVSREQRGIAVGQTDQFEQVLVIVRFGRARVVNKPLLYQFVENDLEHIFPFWERSEPEEFEHCCRVLFVGSGAFCVGVLWFLKHFLKGYQGGFL